MPKVFQSNFQSQKQNIKGMLSAGHIQLQRLIISQPHEINQILTQELSQNPALDIQEEPFFPEDMKSEEADDENWNQDFDKPYDEYETGQRLEVEEHFEWDEYDIASNLEQTVIEYVDDDPQEIDFTLSNINLYRISGSLPLEANKQLQKNLEVLQKSVSYRALPSISPTFEVYEESGNVQAVLISTIADSLIYRKGFGKFSEKAKEYIDRVNDRAVSLNSLAITILENIQGDFFRQTDFNTALRYLLPFSVKNITDLEIDFSLTLDKKLLSKMSDLLVDSKFGVFPLGFFLPSKASLLRLWVVQANKEEISKINDQCDWIKQQVTKRMDNWDAKDKRINLIRPLLDINSNDIKNASKQLIVR